MDENKKPQLKGIVSSSFLVLLLLGGVHIVFVGE